MKITAISSEHSDNSAIALVTVPPLTAQVFEEFKQRIRASALQSLSCQMVSGCLLIKPERFTPELRSQLEQSLAEAEDVVSGAAARKQAEIDQSDKEITLASAAAGFGLPIV
jgi:hypothetical protein